jgi:hypothetical protein
MAERRHLADFVEIFRSSWLQRRDGCHVALSHSAWSGFAIVVWKKSAAIYIAAQ